jgi:hypothetical protein
MDKSFEIARFYNEYASRLNKKKLEVEEFQPLVLNMAYLEIAKAKKEGLTYDTREVFIEYTKAAIDAIPEYAKEVEDPMYMRMYAGFAATAEWDGLWGFLYEYFDSKLGFKIDSEVRKTLRFDSTCHNRYEFDELVTSSEALRKVQIVLSQDMKNAQFSISQTLSNKEGTLISVKDNQYRYIGTDPDFLFEFTLDSFGNLESFSIIRRDKNLRIDYME